MTGYVSNRDVSIGEALPLFFKNYAKFDGRSSRGAYWWLTLINVGISIALGVVDGLVFPSSTFGVIGIVWSLLTLVPGISLGVRRLHDVDKSGWWLLIALVPLVGAVVLIWFAAQPGVRATNNYGPDVEAGRPGPAVDKIFE